VGGYAKHKLSPFALQAQPTLSVSKIRRRLRAQQEIKHHGEQHAMYDQLEWGVQDTENDVKSHPNAKKPASPVGSAI
jgi:hypothetical protein